MLGYGWDLFRRSVRRVLVQCPPKRGGGCTDLGKRIFPSLPESRKGVEKLKKGGTDLLVPPLCGAETALIVGSRPVVDRAECLVVDQLGDAGVVAAHRAGWVAADFEGAETHAQGVVHQQFADEGFALTEDQFDGFSGLDQANGAGQYAQHTCFVS